MDRTHIREGFLESNKGLKAGQIITEIQYHPTTVGKGQNYYWDLVAVERRFVILAANLYDYKCRYLDGDNPEEFYWQAWDTQPRNGFTSNGATSIRFYIE